LSLLDLGRADEAALLWDRALRAEPSHLEATANQTLHAWRRGQIADDEAMRRLEESARAQGSRGRGAEVVGHFLLGIGETARAARELAAAADVPGPTRQQERDAALAVCALGDAATRDQQTASARRLESVLQASPDDRVSRAAYAVGLRRLGAADNARRAWRARPRRQG